MRILHLVHQFLPDHIGGTELYTHWLTQALSRRGHEVAIFHRASVDGTGLDCQHDGEVAIWRAWSGRLSPHGRIPGRLSRTGPGCCF